MSFSLSSDQLSQIIPHASDEKIQLFLPALQEKLNQYDISTPLRVAHFIAQIAHESGSFRYSSENLNYSAKALRSVFGKYFTTDEEAEDCARQPEKIANIVYADRMGNGNTLSGDGWNYRGRGLIQLTGKDNYHTCGLFLETDLLTHPEQVSEDPEISVAAACWFWNARNLNQYADIDDIRQITRRINGGYHGLEDRESFLQRAKQQLDIN